MSDSLRHRFLIQQPEQTAHDAIQHPQARDPGNDDGEGYAHKGEDKQQRDQHPHQSEPEGAYLPAKVGFEIGAAHVHAEHVVEDYGDDGGPAADECRNHKCRRQQSAQRAHRVQAVDQVCPRHLAFERWG